MRLNLGSSDDLRSGYINVDIARPPGILPGAPATGVIFQQADLCKPWPWADSSVEEILAWDVFEHIDNDHWRANRGKIWVMNEAWRVLGDGGVLDLKVPTVAGIGAFCDPTHVSFWTNDDRFYFCEEWNNPEGERGRLGKAYGIVCRFSIIVWKHVEYSPGRWKVYAQLRAVK